MIDKRVIACVLENHVVWVVDLAQPLLLLLLLLLLVVVDPAQTVVTAAYRAMASPICPG